MIHDLNEIKISPRVYSRWMSMLRYNVSILMKKYPDLEAHEIPDEQFRELMFGRGQIFVTVRKTTIRMNVAASDWEFI